MLFLLDVQTERLAQQSLEEDLERVYAYDILLPKAVLERGISNLGDTTNIRRAIHKLVNGETYISNKCSLYNVTVCNQKLFIWLCLTQASWLRSGEW